VIGGRSFELPSHSLEKMVFIYSLEHSMRGLIWFSLLALSLGGCIAAKPPQSVDATGGPPAWIENPGEGAVGSSATHVRGRQAQEELAIARANERLAARLGITVSSVHNINETVANDRLAVTSQRTSRQEMSGNRIYTHVKAIWHDRDRDTLYAWVVPVAPP
jgi:hypothetical protein